MFDDIAEYMHLLISKNVSYLKARKLTAIKFDFDNLVVIGDIYDDWLEHR